MIRAFVTRDWQQLRSYQLELLWRIGSLGFFVALIFFLSGAFPVAWQGAGYFPFAVIGYALADAMWSCLRSTSASVRSDQVVGTLEVMTASPTPLPLLLVGSAAYPLLYASLRLALYLGVAAALGAPFALVELLHVLPVLALSLVLFATLGILAATLILMVKKGEPVAGILGAVSFLFGGTLYPVSAIPEAFQWLSHCTPLTASISATRDILLQGAGLSATLPDLATLALWLVLTALLSALAIRTANKRVRQSGFRSY